MAKRAPTAAESRYMGRVAELGCLICQKPAQVHHIREGQGMSERASNWLTVPLCQEHHTGGFSVHGSMSREFENIYGSELDLLAETIKRLQTR
jgi:hypothetical protein